MRASPLLTSITAIARSLLPLHRLSHHWPHWGLCWRCPLDCVQGNHSNPIASAVSVSQYVRLRNQDQIKLQGPSKVECTPAESCKSGSPYQFILTKDLTEFMLEYKSMQDTTNQMLYKNSLFFETFSLVKLTKKKIQLINSRLVSNWIFQ